MALNSLEDVLKTDRQILVNKIQKLYYPIAMFSGTSYKTVIERLELMNTSGSMMFSYNEQIDELQRMRKVLQFPTRYVMIHESKERAEDMIKQSFTDRYGETNVYIAKTNLLYNYEVFQIRHIAPTHVSCSRQNLP